MNEFTAAQLEPMLAHLDQQPDLLSESLNQCFDLSCKLSLGAAQLWSDLQSTVPTSGVVCLFEVGNAAAAMIVPDTLLLPAWVRTPNDSQKSRLETLAMEWGLNLFPEDLWTAERSTSFAVADVVTFLASCGPAADAVAVALPAIDADLSPLGELVLVWPLHEPQWKAPEVQEFAAPLREGVRPAAVAAVPAAAPVKSDRLARLKKLPVTVSVRLSEKRMSVSQLLAITPGALLTFSKSCDDLLDMYVNNSFYGRGEAVKIGESFGLKVNEIGVKPERPTKIIDG